MRIACVLIPALPIQVVAKGSPHLVGTAFVVTDDGEHPVVSARSRAANLAGIVPGMPVVTARRLCPQLTVLPSPTDAAASIVNSVLESLAEYGPSMHLPSRPHGGTGAFFVEVPAKVRSSAFAAQLARVGDDLGLLCRVGIACDYFTSMIAAETAGRNTDQLSLRGMSENGNTVVVPRGQTKSFLSPQPLARLPLPRTVQHMLHRRGVHTVGQFAELPPPTVKPRSRDLPDVHALARGDGPLLPPSPARTLRAASRQRICRATGTATE